MSNHDHLLHPLVGSHNFEYPFQEKHGLARYALFFQVGDNPNWDGAHLLMPGAQYLGQICAHFEADTGAMPSFPEWPLFRCFLAFNGTLFWTNIRARSAAECQRRCWTVGGLRMEGQPPPQRTERLWLIARYHWARRPTIRRRSPLDAFDCR